MAPYNSELVKKNREILNNESREKAFSILDCFLMDLNSSFQKIYHGGVNSRKEFVDFMDELLYLEYDNKKRDTASIEGERRAITCKQEFYKIIKEDGNLKIKQLISFDQRELRKYFDFFELEEVKTLLRTESEEAGEEVPIERVFEILEKEEANLLGYDYSGTHMPKYYTLLEADLPIENGGYIEYFNVIEE